MTEPAPFDPKRTPSIRWNKKDWPIPPLVADQLDVIWDDVKMLTAALEAQDVIEPADGAPDVEKIGKRLADQVFSLSGDEYKTMREVVYIGLTRAHHTLTPAEFRSVPTTPFEMLIAFYVVRRQSGMYGAALEGAPDTGEAAAIKESPTSS
jgi:hypothetical protein